MASVSNKIAELISGLLVRGGIVKRGIRLTSVDKHSSFMLIDDVDGITLRIEVTESRVSRHRLEEALRDVLSICPPNHALAIRARDLLIENRSDAD